MKEHIGPSKAMKYAFYELQQLTPLIFFCLGAVVWNWVLRRFNNKQ